MPQGSGQDITLLLQAWRGGDRSALDKLVPMVHRELHHLAQRYMKKEPVGHTLQTTALVNEAYLRLVDSSRVRWQDRTHFFAVSAQLMRRILVDFARSRKYAKRGGGAAKVSLDEALEMNPRRHADLVDLDDALISLSKQNPRKSKVVELRFFGGLTVDETAAVLKVSKGTVQRDWNLAKVWLVREMERRDRGQRQHQGK